MKQITYKTAMLMALASGSRASELAHLDNGYKKEIPDGIVFQLVKHKKNARSSEMPGQVFIGELIGKPVLCPCRAIKEYIRRTKHDRKKGEDPLFRAMNRKGKGIEPGTMSRWLTECIKMAGIDVKTGRSIGHSTRSMSTSTAKNKGVSTAQIMKAAGWKTDNMFERFYYIPEFKADFTRTVLNE